MKIDLLPHYAGKHLMQVPTLCAKIVDSMNKDGCVLLHTFEPHNPENNGLYDLLDQLCDYYAWDKSKICIILPNPTFSHSEYNTVSTKMYPFEGLDNPMVPVYPWNYEKSYGMFIGRSSSARIGALYNHLNFKFKDQGVTSFHSAIRNDIRSLSEYLVASGRNKSTVEDIQPYSDIGQVYYGPIWNDRKNMLSTNWSTVYKQIGIEIICETSTEPNCYGITEKTLRPLFYKRPFLIIGSKGYVKFLKEKGIKTFEPIISDDYDNLEELERVDCVFSILEDLIVNNKLQVLHEKFQDVLKHNQHKIFELKKELGTSLKEHYQYIESIPGY